MRYEPPALRVFTYVREGGPAACRLHCVVCDVRDGVRSARLEVFGSSREKEGAQSCVRVMGEGGPKVLGAFMDGEERRAAGLRCHERVARARRRVGGQQGRRQLARVGAFCARASESGRRAGLQPDGMRTQASSVGPGASPFPHERYVILAPPSLGGRVESSPGAMSGRPSAGPGGGGLLGWGGPRPEDVCTRSAKRVAQAWKAQRRCRK